MLESTVIQKNKSNLINMLINLTTTISHILLLLNNKFKKLDKKIFNRKGLILNQMKISNTLKNQEKFQLHVEINPKITL